MNSESKGLKKINTDIEITSNFETGFENLDELLQIDGDEGKLIVLGGRPAMGKTTIALNIIGHNASMGKAVALYSYELIEKDVTQKIISQLSKINLNNLRNPKKTEKEKELINKGKEYFKNLPIFINDNCSITTKIIRSECIELHKANKLQLIVIDYLQLMPCEEKSNSNEQNINAIMRNLKALSKELNCIILVLTQLNRGVEARADKRPLMSDIRESGSVEQDADIGILLYRDSIYNSQTEFPNSAELIVAKNRSGPLGVVELTWDSEFCSFSSISGLN
jgi:replicative DNA helicase